MKDLSLLLFHNSLGGKMIKSFRAFCNGDSSTSTLNQHPPPPPLMQQEEEDGEGEKYSPSTKTLEEMILQLEIEEKLARKSRMDEYVVGVQQQQQRRMSCVNNSDILRSARNALNQYPRFSLDGKDAMYRSSFRNFEATSEGRKSFCCNRQLRTVMEKTTSSSRCLPPMTTTLAGESVVWCKPGVVGKLMGLEAMPVPVNGYYYYSYSSCGRRARQSGNSSSSILKRRGERKHHLLQEEEICVGGAMKPISKKAAIDEKACPIRYFL